MTSNYTSTLCGGRFAPNNSEYFVGEDPLLSIFWLLQADEGQYFCAIVPPQLGSVQL